MLLNYQKYAKLSSTYTGMKCGADGRMHTAYSLISTWRMNSSSSPFGGDTKADKEGGNLQNIPKRGEEGSLIRSIFVADEGKVLLASDRVQAEAMVVAWLSKDSFAEAETFIGLVLRDSSACLRIWLMILKQNALTT